MAIKRFISCQVPVYACNFRCTYCYVGQHQSAFKQGVKPLCLSPEKIAEKLSVERLGGQCYFNLCGFGETLLHPDIIALVDALTRQGHYADIITNGIAKSRLESLIKLLDESQRQHVLIKFSFHYLELKHRNLLDRFCQNVHLVRDAGISYSIEVTPHDGLIEYIPELKRHSIEHFGALPHITVARNEMTRDIALLSAFSKEEYRKTWGGFDSDLFDFKIDLFNEKRMEFCYAGVWSLFIDLFNGYCYQCYGGDIIGNLKDDSPIAFRPICKCRQPHCFNGHAFLALGDIPGMDSPTYCQERDRVTDTGDHWLQPETAAFFSTRLSESNPSLSEREMKDEYRRALLLRAPNAVKSLSLRLLSEIRKRYGLR